MKRYIVIIGLMALLSGCATFCPATANQLPFNVDPTLMQPPQVLDSIEVPAAVVTKPK
jgi:PBP1b-binding outer membrane lipoprotein LpoB